MYVATFLQTGASRQRRRRADAAGRPAARVRQIARRYRWVRGVTGSRSTASTTTRSRTCAYAPERWTDDERETINNHVRATIRMLTLVAVAEAPQARSRVCQCAPRTPGRQRLPGRLNILYKASDFTHCKSFLVCSIITTRTRRKRRKHTRIIAVATCIDNFGNLLKIIVN